MRAERRRYLRARRKQRREIRRLNEGFAALERSLMFAARKMSKALALFSSSVGFDDEG